MTDLRQIPHSQVYEREHIPARYHYKTHANIGDIIVMLESGYELHRRSSRMFNRYLSLPFGVYVRIDFKMTKAKIHFNLLYMAIMDMTINSIQ
jgi:hypothetical protein